MQENNAELAKEAIDVFIWCPTQSPDSYKQWRISKLATLKSLKAKVVMGSTCVLLLALDAAPRPLIEDQKLAVAGAKASPSPSALPDELHLIVHHWNPCFVFIALSRFNARIGERALALDHGGRPVRTRDGPALLGQGEARQWLRRALAISTDRALASTGRASSSLDGQEAQHGGGGAISGRSSPDLVEPMA
ncbi:hypothetical protein ZWY2020_037789 [Hordeum vulgare]|nr:hypothetical protein ZWY2020_037789 [Hordeum vulgare]